MGIFMTHACSVGYMRIIDDECQHYGTMKTFIRNPLLTYFLNAI